MISVVISTSSSTTRMCCMGLRAQKMRNLCRLSLDSARTALLKMWRAFALLFPVFWRHLYRAWYKADKPQRHARPRINLDLGACARFFRKRNHARTPGTFAQLIAPCASAVSGGLRCCKYSQWLLQCFAPCSPSRSAALAGRSKRAEIPWRCQLPLREPSPWPTMERKERR